MIKDKFKIETARQLLDLDPFSGTMTWKVRGPEWFQHQNSAADWNARWAGKPALNAVNGVLGYREGYMLGAKLYAHRVVYALSRGFHAVNHVDHINGDRADNRPQNLRDVLRSANSKNMRMHVTNTSGHTGVARCKRSGKWIAYIGHGENRVRLGRFDTVEEACEVRKGREKVLGYHPNHGIPLNAMGGPAWQTTGQPIRTGALLSAAS